MNHSDVNSSVAFSIIIILCKHHVYVVPKYFVTSQSNPESVKQSLPFCPSSPPLAAPSLPFVSMELPILDIPCKRSRAVCNLLHLSSSTWCKVFKVDPCHSLCQHSIAFPGLIILHRMFIPRWVYLFIHGGDIWIIPTFWKWQSTPGFLPGKSHGRRSMLGYSL